MDTEVDVLHVNVVQITLSDVCSLVRARADFHWVNIFPERMVFLEPYRELLSPGSQIFAFFISPHHFLVLILRMAMGGDTGGLIILLIFYSSLFICPYFSKLVRFGVRLLFQGKQGLQVWQLCC